MVSVIAGSTSLSQDSPSSSGRVSAGCASCGWSSHCKMASMSSCSRCAILLPHLLMEEYDPFPPGLPSNALRDSFNFSGFGRSKLPILVDEHNALILDMDHHVWFAIAIHVLERQGDRRYILPIAK